MAVRNAQGAERAGLGLPCAPSGREALLPSSCACLEELWVWAAKWRARCTSAGGMCLNTHPLRESVATATNRAALNFPIFGLCIPESACGL